MCACIFAHQNNLVECKTRGKSLIIVQWLSDLVQFTFLPVNINFPLHLVCFVRFIKNQG